MCARARACVCLLKQHLQHIVINGINCYILRWKYRNGTPMGIDLKQTEYHAHAYSIGLFSVLIAKFLL